MLKVEQALRLYIDIKIMESSPSGQLSYVAADFIHIFILLHRNKHKKIF